MSYSEWSREWGGTPSDTETQNTNRYPFVKWDDKTVQVEHEHKIATALENLPNIDMTAIHNSPEAKRLVNMQSNKLNDIIHNASESVMFERPDNYRGRHRRVPWWSTECTVARDRMRFWSGLWCYCDRVRMDYCLKVQKKFTDKCAFGNENITSKLV